MMVLDTNVLSELMRRQPDANVLKCINEQPEAELAITAITVGEILHGILRLPKGKRKTALHDAFHAMLNEELAGRVLPFDQAAAGWYADLITKREKLGRPVSMADGQIAAICLTHSVTLATRNTKDFNNMGLALLNPWK